MSEDFTMVAENRTVVDEGIAIGESVRHVGSST
jgi:hypothetical protein